MVHFWEMFLSALPFPDMGRQQESYDIVFIFHPKTMVHLLEMSYQLYPFFNNGETTGKLW